MSVIKFKLEKFERQLVFQVLEQDESLRASGYSYADKLIFNATNDWRLTSSSCPHYLIHQKTVCIRGYDKTRDLDCYCIPGGFASNEERDRVHDEIMAMFLELVKSVSSISTPDANWRESTSWLAVTPEYPPINTTVLIETASGKVTVGYRAGPDYWMRERSLMADTSIITPICWRPLPEPTRKHTVTIRTGPTGKFYDI